MATNRLMEEEGIFRALREQYGSIENAVTGHAEGWAGIGAEASIVDEATLREALAGPQRDQLMALLLPSVQAPPSDSARVGPEIHGNLRDRTEAVGNNERHGLHAEKNQDIEVENDETHAISVGVAQEVTVGGSSLHEHNRGDLEFATLIDREGSCPDLESYLLAGNRDDDGPSHLLGDLHSRFANTHLDDQAAGIVGDWNGDGRDTLGVIGDADGDAIVDGADFL